MTGKSCCCLLGWTPPWGGGASPQEKPLRRHKRIVNGQIGRISGENGLAIKLMEGSGEVSCGWGMEIRVYVSGLKHSEFIIVGYVRHMTTCSSMSSLHTDICSRFKFELRRSKIICEKFETAIFCEKYSFVGSWESTAATPSLRKEAISTKTAWARAPCSRGRPASERGSKSAVGGPMRRPDTRALERGKRRCGTRRGVKKIHPRIYPYEVATLHYTKQHSFNDAHHSYEKNQRFFLAKKTQQ